MSEPENTGSGEGTGKRRIIVVDDEPFVLKVLARQLSLLGYEVHTFERAQDAISMLDTGGPGAHVVFTDLQMPEMDGVEFVRRLAGARYEGHLVLVSGEDPRILRSAERLARAHGLNVLGALPKPATREQLKDHLSRAEGAREARGSEAGPKYPLDDLVSAIRTGQLVNYYQPQVSLATGAVAGVEALVRWRHPRDGIVSAGEFIGLVEQHGLVDEFVREVLPSALSEIAGLQLPGDELRLSVNLSMDNLNALDFPDFVAASAANAGFPLSRLSMEITERRLVGDQLSSLDILTRLKLKRIGLAIDDFGTGHASLAQLRDFQYDEIKIDCSFIHGSYADESLDAIVRASLSLAKQLKMTTVAEGVENANDWHHMRELACDRAQGYFIGRPMAVEELPRWRNEWASRFRQL
ncbi:EAL domain-containing protein [Paraburkholderia tagetis]|uniref:EAL domain-containing response regulator n=1 Tax=Paraburkholderia tagetis TaxID=2913261 RepID=A0A9X1RP57_9BURK|nr:EAL domain-containing response regulator [Paraburkholderia tagetis]MCG5074135.1 EAL domain-containing response regulator [Paraburkholderia tagetis]